VASLGRPGGHVTGLTASAAELSGRRLELLSEAVPGLRRIGVLGDWDPAAAEPSVLEIAAAAAALHIETMPLVVHDAGAIGRVFEAAVGEHVEGLVVLDGPLLLAQRADVVALAARHRLPAVYGHRDFVAAGGLMSYGVREAELYRRAATYVDKLLRGGDPALMPIGHPMRFELVLNQSSAARLDIEFPDEILLDADYVLR